MTREKWILAGMVMLLVGGGAWFLSRVSANHRLGTPGLKMVAQPVHIEPAHVPESGSSNFFCFTHSCTFDQKGGLVGTNTVDLPIRVLDFTSAPIPVTFEELDWLPDDTVYGRRAYVSQRGGEPFWVQLSVVVMGTDRTSIHKPEICLDGQGWTIDKSELLTIGIDRPIPYELPIMKLTATKSGVFQGQQITKRAVFVYWFASENRLTAQHGERMWWMAKDLIMTGVLQRWAYVTYLAVCDPGQENTTFDRLKEFIAASVPEFQLVTGPTPGSAPRDETAAVRP